MGKEYLADMFESIAQENRGEKQFFALLHAPVLARPEQGVQLQLQANLQTMCHKQFGQAPGIKQGRYRREQDRCEQVQPFSLHQCFCPLEIIL